MQAEDFAIALGLWQDLVKVHCSKRIDKSARDRIQQADYSESDMEIITDFEDECDDLESKMYGNRKGIRANSPFLKVFQMFIDKVKLSESDIEVVENSFHCLNLVETMTRQYLSLFPFISAALLKNGLVTNCYVELHWKESRRVFKNVDQRLMWPLLYFSTLNREYRNKAAEIGAVDQIPILKFGRSHSQKRKNIVDKSQEVNVSDKFIPTLSKHKKQSSDMLLKNESVTASKEMWTPKKDVRRSKESKKQSYLVQKTLDYDLILRESNLPIESLTVTGPCDNEGIRQTIVLSKTDIKSIITKYDYVVNDVPDALLSLVEKKFRETGNGSDLNFYSIQMARIILNGDRSMLRPGKFLTLLPRYFFLPSSEETKKLEKKKREEIEKCKDKKKKKVEDEDLTTDCCHFTLVSNFNCDDGEVNVYETFEGFRCEKQLLLDQGLDLIRILSGSQGGDIVVNCVNVQLQEENECGLLSCALAAQLCLNSPADREFLKKVHKVRETSLECFKQDCLLPFKTTGRITRAQKTFLFSTTK